MRKQVRVRRNPVAPRVALLVETSLSSGREILRGIARYVREHQPWALYHEAHGLEESVPRWLRRWKGDGIIARIQTRSMAQAIADSGLPTVDVLGVVPGLPFPLVHVDNGAVARLAADHLLQRGLRHFGFFGIEGENWSQERGAQFASAVLAFGGTVSAYELQRSVAKVRSWEGVEDRLARWVAQLPKPCGVLVASDQRGPQLLEACRRAGVSVPDELAVIGVDNDEPLCEVCSPPLSSIQPGHREVGYRAAERLDALMRGGRDGASPVRVLPEEIVARGSTEMLAVEDASLALALRLIRDHAHEGLGVAGIAREVGLSRSVLQRRFRATFKRSVHSEIVRAKVKRAQELLTQTDLPLAVVAEKAGFRYAEYMGAVLRQRLGKTPRQVRGGSRSER